MRLVNTHTLKLEEIPDDQARPSYAILSHTWGADDDEISFRDIQQGFVEKPGNGHFKFVQCCRQAKIDGLEYVWIDTCCINKDSSTELSEAINSMYQWYKDAAICYAYLRDVPAGDEVWDQGSKFRSSRWFRRGWTLQELLAPKQLHFYDTTWTSLGTKAALSGVIEETTRISRLFLLGWADLEQASVAQRMSWAASRETKRKEDTAYSFAGHIRRHNTNHLRRRRRACIQSTAGSNNEKDRR